MKMRLSPFRVFVLGVLLVGLTAFLCLGIGSDRSISPWDVSLWKEALAGAAGGKTTILFSIRLPRLLLAMLVGGSLALAGLVFQGLLQNPLADPFILGVSGGSGLAAVLVQRFGPQDPLLLVIASFGGGLGAIVLVERLAGRDGELDRGRLILAGVVLNAFFAALISLFLILSGDDLPRIFSWLMGSLSMPDLTLILPLGGLSLAAAALLWRMSHPLNLLTLGDVRAYHLGLDTVRFKRMTLFLASFLTAVAVSLAGMIGFIGMFVPHAIRLMLGGDHRLLIPGVITGGACLLMVADTVVRLSPAGVELPVGTLTALLGAPFFLWLLKRGSDREWWGHG